MRKCEAGIIDCGIGAGVEKISAAVFQSGGDLAEAFREMDADGSGEISAEEFRVAVRRRLPSLAVLSDAQLEAVVRAFDADGLFPGQVLESRHGLAPVSV